MRLGQLSRKINVRPADIVLYLSSKGLVIQENANSRVNDPEVKLVLEKFAPHLALEDMPAEEQSEPAVVNETPATEGMPENTTPDPIEIVDASPPEELKKVPESPQESVVNEVIKAPKIELQGLKVLGKIDLPQAKKKEAPVDNAEEDSTASPQKEERKEKDHSRESRSRGERHERPRRQKNPIAMQREMEAREAEERKKEALKREKESRTQYYLNRVKPAAPVKKATLVDEPLSQIHDEAPDQPRTLWGKFVKWLTSY